MRVDSLKISGDSEQQSDLFCFVSERLNLIVASSAAESRAVIDVIVQALYQPYVGARAVPPTIRGCELETSIGARSVTIACDFAAGTSDIVSCGEKCNYAEPAGASLCGVDSATFEEIAAIDRTNFEPAKSLLHCQRIATLLHRAVYGQPHPNQAVALVLEGLDHYEFQGQVYKIDDLLGALAGGRVILEERLQRIEEAKGESDGKQAVLTELEREIADRQLVLKRQEQLHLSKALSDLDKQIMEMQEQAAHSTLLSAELHELGDFSAFPIDAVAKVEELWGKRASTMANYAELTREVEEAEGNLSADGDLKNCQSGDAQLLYNLAGTLSNVQAELDDLTLRHSREMRRVKDAGVDFDKVSRTRQTVLSMNARDLDDANRLVLLLKTTKQKLADAVQVLQRIESDVSEAKLEFVQATNSERRWRSALLWLSVSPVAFLIAIVAFPYSQTLPGMQREQLITVLLTISITAFVFSTFVFVLLHGVKRSRRERFDRLSRECAEYAQAEVALAQDLASVNRQADMLAQRNNASSGNELFKQVIGYAGTAEQLKELDLLEQLMFVREKQKYKLIAEIQPFFQRAHRSNAVITPQLTTLLADDIQRFYESVRQTEKISSSLSNKRSELRFLAGEIADIESQLRDAFYRARLEAPEDLAQAIVDFRARTLEHRRFQQIQEELSLRAQATVAEGPEETVELEILIAKRKDVNARLQNLLTAHPSLLEIAVEELSTPVALDEVVRQIQVLQGEYSQCEEAMRSSLRRFEDVHPKIQSELEVLDRNMKRIEQDKRAAELAVSLLERVAQDTHWQWAELLTKQWERICTRSSTGVAAESGIMELLGITSVTWNERLEISVGLHNGESVLGEPQLLNERKDIGMLIDLLLRLLVALIVCRIRPVPVFVNEPFADLDDRAALAVLNLLMTLASAMQITILTAYPERYRQLAGQLDSRTLSLIHSCH